MYRLLIVDDERHIVDSLSLMFAGRDELDLEVHTTCQSDEAIALLSSMKVDIVILDIKMPGLSGLDVFERVRERWPQIQVIFLTGYSSFEYIYQANRIANMQYLLKTEDDEAIVHAVAEAARAIDEDRRRRDLSAHTLWQQQVIAHLTHRSVLRDLLAGKNAADIAESERVRGKNFRFDLTLPVYLAHICFAAEDTDEMTERMVKYGRYAQEMLGGRFAVTLVDRTPASAAMLLQPAAGWSYPMSPIDYVRECLNDLVGSDLLSDSGFQLFIWQEAVPWDALCATLDMLAGHASGAGEISAERFGAIVDAAAQERDHQKACGLSPPGLVNRFSFALGQLDEAAVASVLAELRRHSTALRSMHHLSAIHAYHAVGNVLIECIQTHSLQEALAQRTGLYRLYTLHDFADWGCAYDYLQSLSCYVMDLIRAGSSHHLDRLVRSIKEYVRRNLDKPITLTSIANHLKYNSSYISRLFKQKTNGSLSAYIAGARVRRAQELLRGTNQSIQSIAPQVGFDSPHYFAMTFKKLTGSTPSEYRNRGGE